jgi:xylulokinase
MQLLDLSSRDWSEEVCSAVGVKREQLARVCESCAVTGYVTTVAAESTGLPCGIPVAGGGGDNASAAIGSGVYESGQAFTTIGTSGVVFAPTDRAIIDPEGRVHTFCAAVPGQWHVMGVTQAAGLSLNWFRKTLAPDLSYRELDRAVKELPIGADRLIYLPYLMGERTPLLDSDARGVFFGLSAMHTREHMARAVMEGVSYSLLDCLSLIRGMGVEIREMALCGGGARSELWRQMLTDLYALPLCVRESSEGAVLGAAILGGCAAGVYASVEEGCARAVRSKDVTAVNAEAHGQYMRVYEIYNGLYAALKPSFDRLKQLD